MYEVWTDGIEFQVLQPNGVILRSLRANVLIKGSVERIREEMHDLAAAMNKLWSRKDG